MFSFPLILISSTHSHEAHPASLVPFFFRPGGNRSIRFVTYLVQVDGGLPELLLGLVEVAHTDLTEVTGVVLVDVGAVVVLTTGHTTTTRALAVLADTTVTGGHVAAAVIEKTC